MNCDYTFIKTRRKELNLTQQQLAKEVGVSAAYIQQLENNVKQRPSFEVFLKIIRALNLNIDDIMGVKESWQDKLTKDGKVKNLNLSEYVNNLNKLSKATNTPINTLLGVPKIDDDLLPILDKDGELKNYKQQGKNYLDSMENISKVLHSALSEIKKTRENIKNGKLNECKANEIINILNELPDNADELLNFAQEYEELKLNKYGKLYLVKENIINILKILNYDINKVTDSFIDSLVTVVIRTIEFEMFNFENDNQRTSNLIGLDNDKYNP